MVEVKYPVALAACFLWVGFVGAISFMEAWLKFRARGITIPLGLEIGRLVFNALNKMEWLFATMITVSLFFSKGYAGTSALFYFCALFLLLLQTVWLLPALDKRAEMLVNGETPPRSKLHFFYIGMEVAKVLSLLAFGINNFT